jgi:cytosine/adenosine deaminase-related metal-dependent hydrolase
MSIGRQLNVDPFVLRARYVFPVAGAPIADGFVAINGDRIVAVGPCGAGVSPANHHAGGTPARQTVLNLGNVAILPGLVNAHTHLDFSDLRAPLGKRGIGFVDWIRQAMVFRRRAAKRVRRPVAQGLQESVRCGVTTLGDIAQPGWPAADVTASSLKVTVFQELIAPTADRVDVAMKLAQSHVHSGAAVGAAAGTDHQANWQPGLSPHAPYSVHPDLLAALIALSAAEHVPLAMHLAESREELELLRHGTGPLRAFLEDLGAWDAAAIPAGTRPLDYLRRLASAHRTLVIHGNYLDDEEIAFLGANASRMTVIHCPRTHQWFAHDPYPLETMLSAGVAVALGTDGRGSSPDLNLLAELRLAAEQHPAVGRDRILQMGTILGARALGWESQIGTLEPGKQADLAIVALPDRDAADPHELLFHSTAPIVGCYCRGTAIDHR